MAGAPIRFGPAAVAPELVPNPNPDAVPLAEVGDEFQKEALEAAVAQPLADVAAIQGPVHGPATQLETVLELATVREMRSLTKVERQKAKLAVTSAACTYHRGKLHSLVKKRVADKEKLHTEHVKKQAIMRNLVRRHRMRQADEEDARLCVEDVVADVTETEAESDADMYRVPRSDMSGSSE